MLDQINTYLDDLEDRNDSLNGKLHELLESNRQARLEFRAQLLGSQSQEEHCPADGDSSTSKEYLNKDNGDSKWVMRRGVEFSKIQGWKYLWKLTQLLTSVCWTNDPWSVSPINFFREFFSSTTELNLVFPLFELWCADVCFLSRLEFIASHLGLLQ